MFESQMDNGRSNNYFTRLQNLIELIKQLMSVTIELIKHS